MINSLKVFLSRNDINTKRQLNVDFAKCLAIIFMVFVHVFIYPLYKNVDTGLGYFIYAIGGSFLAAPVFMIAMGFGLAFTNSGSPNQIIKRGIKIFILSYILNIVRLFVPFIYEASTSSWAQAYENQASILFIGDILQFAGLALIVFGLIKKTKLNPIYLFIISLIIVIGWTFIPIINTESFYVSAFCGLFLPIYFDGMMSACFPLVTWFVFVAFGYMFACIMKKVKNLNRFYLYVLLIGAVLFATFFTIDEVFEISAGKCGYDYSEYYNHIMVAVYSIGSTMVMFSLFYFLSKITHEKFNELCIKMSSCVNEIYIISWILIFWVFYTIFGLAFPGEYDMWVYLISSTVILIASVISAYYWRKLKKNKFVKKTV